MPEDSVPIVRLSTMKILSADRNRHFLQALLTLLRSHQNLFQLSEGCRAEGQCRDGNSNAFPVYVFHCINSLDVGWSFLSQRFFAKRF